MDAYDINAETRVPTGKSGTRKLKREGLIPGILYSEGNSIPISFKEDEIRPLLDSRNDDVEINLALEGKTLKTRVKEVQRDPVNRVILHVDLMPAEGYIH